MVSFKNLNLPGDLAQIPQIFLHQSTYILRYLCIKSYWKDENFFLPSFVVNFEIFIESLFFKDTEKFGHERLLICCSIWQHPSFQTFKKSYQPDVFQKNIQQKNFICVSIPPKI